MNTKSMKRLIDHAIYVMVVLLLTFSVTSTAYAAPKALEVTIEVDTMFGGDANFTAYGPAVDTGLICRNGMVHDVSTITAGPPDATRLNFIVLKKFVCGDGSGDFVLNLKAHVVFDPYQDVGTWNVMTDLGSYANLHGQGLLEGTPITGGVHDVYTGWVSNSPAATPGSREATIEAHTIFGENGADFVAYGPAVDAGLICATGTVYDDRVIAAGPPDAARLNFLIIKRFVCNDGSGEFNINLRAHVIFDPYQDVGTWNVIKGSGSYARLYGQGLLEGTPFEGGVQDVYTGWFH